MTKEEKLIDKKRIRELTEATLKGYKLAEEHFKKFGKFLGGKKLQQGSRRRGSCRGIISLE